ncbi:hypothetical protein J2W52_003260 [Rhizobium miluonense]|uniref:Uncharacterized protein n=1 Tax=Rhizobium miluonense TaxID=411945 RepID=A0ABU1SRM7_9HYPH|nr:hypothetical protein [Rhizobium miluonense]
MLKYGEGRRATEFSADAMKLMESRWSEIKPAAFRNSTELELETVSNLLESAQPKTLETFRIN